jgi:glycosyltransferase involved in cell wall biosynthesis
MLVSLIAPAPFDTLSGGYVYDRRMVAGLREAGHTVEVVALAGSYPLTDAAADTAARSAWNRLPAHTRPVIDGLALPAFLRLADEIAPRGAVGLIHHPTALETGQSEQDRMALRDAEQRLMPLLARVIVTSVPTANRLAADFGVARERIAVVVPGTEEAPRSAGSGGPTCRILSVGTLIPRKGHDVLLRALARLFDLDWQLTVAGSPERDPVHARTLSALAESLGITSRVRFTGELADEALETLWRETDLFALATHWEGYGMAVAEALKRGLPVAVTSGGAAASLVPVDAGVVCSPGDYNALSLAMRRLVFCPTLRREMADAAWRAGRALPSWGQQAGAFATALAEAPAL